MIISITYKMLIDHSMKKIYHHRNMQTGGFKSPLHLRFGFIVLHDLPILQLGSFKSVFGSLADLITAPHLHQDDHW